MKDDPNRDAGRNDTPSGALDIAANRRARKWSSRALAGRALWEMTAPAFAWSPRPLWGWRNLLLRLFGARIGRHVHIYPSVRVAIPWNLVVGDNTAVGDGAIVYSIGAITLGANVTVSQNAHLCAGGHDYRRRDLPLLAPPIIVADGAWVCADAFVGPGVCVGAHAIVGARAAALSNVAPWTIVIGNPARVQGAREGFLSE
jgi:putative colanic acid biosynthesis acetyltransferase WcaF